MPDKKEGRIDINEIELKTIDVRLNSVKDATQRSRFIFLAMTVISSAVLLATWNITFSFDREKAFLPKFTNETIKFSEQEIYKAIPLEKIVKRVGDFRKNDLSSSEEDLYNQATSELHIETREKLISEKYRLSSNRDEVISEWIKNRVISIGLLGIRIDATDLSVVGSLSLIIVTVWFFFCARRENRAIVTLLRNVFERWEKGEVGLDVCRMVYYGVVNSLVFIDMRGGDDPIGGLRKTTVKISARSKNHTKEGEGAKTQKTRLAAFFQSNVPFVRRIIGILAFLPPITIFVIVTSDVFSLFRSSPYRDFQQSLAIFFWRHPEWSDIFQKIFIFDGIALLACWYTASICWRCRQFSKKTSDTIVEFRRETQVE